MFSDEQKKQLAALLNLGHVKRNPRGHDYVEGWHAIAEANRIFGFDAWSRETVETRCVMERERKLGKSPNQYDGFGVTYTARVRVTVGGVVRDGSGTGHGADRDLGMAHESALKEAETDAMKRALMTFGNPFGLALYDKERANVTDEDDSRPRFISECAARIDVFTDADALGTWWNSDDQKKARRDFELDPAEVDGLKQRVLTRRAYLTKPQGIAA